MGGHISHGLVALSRYRDDDLVCMRLALAALLVAIALPAQAHTPDELEEWQTDWMERVTAQRGLSVGLTAEYADMVQRHLWYFHPEPVRAPTEPQSVASQPRAPSRAIGNVEQWRGLVAAYFPAGEVDRALCIMGHESGGNPNAKNPRSSARGLMQILASLWAPHFGVSYDDLYDPDTNMRIARAVWDQQGWWAWSPYKRGLCH